MAVATTMLDVDGVERRLDVDVDPDGIPVYCTTAEGWVTTRGGFCECCGARDHDCL